MSEFRRRLMAQKLGGLPPGYTQAEYIQGTGAQYIDTNIVLNENNTIVLNGCINSTGGNFGLFGVSNPKTGKGFTVGITGAMSRLIFNDYFNDRLDLASVFRANNTIIISNKILRYNDTIKVIDNTNKFNTIDTALLFNSRNTAYGKCGGYVYGLKIFEYDNLILNFIPVINPQGEIGMYDTVSCKFFGNDGTGVFTAGIKNKQQ